MYICVNIFFNFLFILSGLIIFLSKNNNVIYYKNLICIITISYFILDCIKEIYLEKRLMYIPHHLVGIFIFYKLYKSNQDIKTLKIFGLLYSLIEFTSALINIRIYLKEGNSLSYKADCILFCFYTLLRLFAFPYLIVIGDNKMRYCCFTILTMSIYWIYIWSLKLLKKKIF